MRKTVLASALLASFVAAPAVSFAEDAAPAAPAFTSNVTLASEYIYRGIGQTNRKPAIQGGFDYAHSSGLYVGTWASNVSWLSDQAAGTISSSLEWDFYGGYKTAIDDFGIDVGVLQYYYPGTGYGNPLAAQDKCGDINMFDQNFVHLVLYIEFAQNYQTLYITFFKKMISIT